MPTHTSDTGNKLVDTITRLLDGDHQVAQQVIAQLDTNPLTTFTTLVLKEEKKQSEDKDKSKPTVIDATQCK